MKSFAALLQSSVTVPKRPMSKGVYDALNSLDDHRLRRPVDAVFASRDSWGDGVHRDAILIRAMRH